jgi:hypothetical protein
MIAYDLEAIDRGFNGVMSGKDVQHLRKCIVRLRDKFFDHVSIGPNGLIRFYISHAAMEKQTRMLKRKASKERSIRGSTVDEGKGEESGRGVIPCVVPDAFLMPSH